MDRALLKEREAFKKRALAQPSIERKKKHKERDENDESAAKRIKSTPKIAKPFDYKKASGSSQYKFSVLAKIVKYMKSRHQQGDTHPLDIDEILDETNQLDIGNHQKHWLSTEALINNPKVKVVGGDRYAFCPKYDIRDKRSLLNLLKKHDLHGYGGIFQEDIEESVPNVQKVLQSLGDRIVYVTRPTDKKKILFFNDKYCQLDMDEEFTKLWRGVSVEGLDEQKIEEYLEKQGITSMQDIGVKRVLPQKRKKTARKLKKGAKKHNEHLDYLEDYSELTNKQT